MARHHPMKYQFPHWTIDLGNNLFHKTVTVCQNMNPTPFNLAKIRGLIDSLEVVYLLMRRELDEGGE